jgi:hypothetical protein
VNFPVVGFAAHGISAFMYFSAGAILIYCISTDDTDPLFIVKEKMHLAGSCSTFRIDHDVCKENWQSCADFISYCKSRNDRSQDGGLLEPDLSPKSMIIVDIVISFVCMLIAFIGSYFAYEDYQDSEYEDEEELDTPPGQTYTIGRNGNCNSHPSSSFDQQPKPSQMV